MVYFSGSSGRLQMKRSTDTDFFTVGRATNWILNVAQSSLDTTALEDTDRTVRPGIRSTTGSCTVFYYQETAGNQTQNDASKLINTLLKKRTTSTVEGIAAEPEKVGLRMYILDGSDSNKGRVVECEVYFTSASTRMGVGEVLSVDLSFDVIGAPINSTI